MFAWSFLFEAVNQYCSFSGFHCDQGSRASARSFTLPCKPVFEDPTSEIRITGSVYRVPNLSIPNSKAAGEAHERL